MLRSLCVIACLAFPLRADVLVVDPGGGPGGAALLQAALDAAQPGDILLLRAGDYASAVPLVAQGKGITLLADAGEVVNLPGLSLDLVPAEQTLVLRGVRIGPAESLALFIGSKGPVWVEDCRVDSGPAAPSSFPAVGAQMTSPALVVARGSYKGGDGADELIGEDATSGGAGLSLVNADATLFEVQAHGGVGGDGTYDQVFKANGGAGLASAFSEAVVLAGSFTGGAEGLGVPATTHGGAAISFAFGNAWLRQPTLVPGGVTGAGFPGIPIEAVFCPIEEWSEPVASLVVDSPVREFGTGHLVVHGEPGHLVLVQLSTSIIMELNPTHQGGLVVPPTRVMVLGALDATGRLDAPFTLGALPTGVEGKTIFLQLMTTGPGGVAMAGGASALTWISAAF